MTKVVITRIKAENIANIPALEINPDGADVFITGKNGAGKTTIRKALMWTFTGSTSDGEKLVPYGVDKMPLVEIEMYDGAVTSKISKEMVLSKKGERISYTANCYLNGLPVMLKDFNAHFEQYAPLKALPLLLNPFEFFKLNTDTRREMLTALFCDVTDEQVLASNESLAEFDKANFPHVKNIIRTLRKEVQDIPARISTLASKIKDIPDFAESREKLRELRQQKAKVELKLGNWQETVKTLKSTQSKISSLNLEITRKQARVQELKIEVATKAASREELLTMYHAAQTDTNCPTCGQEMPSALKDSRINKIIVEGTKIRGELEDAKSRLAKAEEELSALQAEFEKLMDSANVEYDELTELSRQKDALQREISALERELATADYQQAQNAEFQKDIDALSAREKKVGKEITECEKQILLNEKFVLRQADLITDAINSYFQYVKFKMFDVSKSGEVKNVCTATMDGVPFELLSKGEKMKAALDVLQTLQKYYQVAFPLIIDDAESYTSNSILDLENQKFILQVAEIQHLKITLAFLEEEGARIA